MELTGYLTDIQQDFISGSVRVILTINEKETLRSGYEGLKESPLSIVIDKQRKKRSLSANAYFHVLVGKIAEALTISKTKAKNMAITKYGQPMHNKDGEPLFVMLPEREEDMNESECFHAKYVRESTDHPGCYIYLLFYGSHTYDTKEMSALIDGTVADAKELGIETLPPEELQKMMSLWRSE